MHRFPPAADLNFLIGKELRQVCLDPHSVQLHFLNGGGIQIEYEFDHVAGAEHSSRYDCTAHKGPPLLLHRLIARTIESLDVAPLQLSLIFDDGQRLILDSMEGPFECGHIRLSDNPSEMIVY